MNITSPYAGFSISNNKFIGPGAGLVLETEDIVIDGFEYHIAENIFEGLVDADFAIFSREKSTSYELAVNIVKNQFINNKFCRKKVFIANI